ncbi:GNAT family N-acetyltransferase [Pseudalkalibacillus berkeleyi]|uniref:GNAT family N-acetyltransferase n=1 Tax=Pseudalkalibacillus berkeleyi TaxID=1069813 RepID=A0ABS9GYX1_9BACL|nr:GNAT family N-acetyltransferase [Pseudalkalibacillus berkeleyi]MCF6136805.1 GNAT family N-acetyltransferase [Pseudalkalibacillus berkeleyi]
MDVYELERDASFEIRKQIAQLLTKQRISNENSGTFDQIMTGIHLALEQEDTAYIVVAELDEEIVGIAFFNIGVSLARGGQYMWLNELYVQEDLRNKGIARKLLLHVVHWAERTGIKSIELETGINNVVTKHIYNSLGFYEVVSKRYGFSF